MKKQLKKNIGLYVLAILAIGLLIYSGLSSLATLPFSPAHTSPSEEKAYFQPATHLPSTPLSLQISTDHYPLQAIKVEEVTVNVTQRVRPIYNLFSIALLLFGFENTSFETKACYFPVKPLQFAAPIYILFRQIII